MSLRHLKQSPEPGADEGASAGAAAKTEAAPAAAAVAGSEPKAPAPAPEAKPAPAAPAAPAPAVALVAETKAEPAATPAGDPVAELRAKLVALEAERAKDAEKLAALESGRAEDARALRLARLDGLLDTVKLEPAYREFARAQLASIDPTTDAGKAAVDTFVAQHPAMVARVVTGVGDPTMNQWLDAKAKANPGSGWAFIGAAELAKVTVT